MNGAQITMLVLYAINIYVAIDKHGQPQPVYNKWVTIIAVAISYGILAWGGFWS